MFINQNNKFLILENIANKAPDLDYILVKVNEVIGDNGFVLDGPNNNLNNIQTWRDAIRTKATEMETAIDNCSSVEDIAKLWVVHDKDGNKSGILYDWPELGS